MALTSAAMRGRAPDNVERYGIFMMVSVRYLSWAGAWGGGPRVQKILVVDDETELLLVLEAALRKSGFDVETASNGLEGLELARTGKPDLVVLDLRLPTLDGHTVCQM